MLSSLLLLAAIASVGNAVITCNVEDYGGVPDGENDIGPAICTAYSDCVVKAVTQNPADTVLYVPTGDYALYSKIHLENVENFTIEIDGNLTLVFDPKLTGHMFWFDNCNNVVWKGTGTIYGNGEQWRPNGDLTKYSHRPRLVRFDKCNNVDISGVTLNNSPMFHLVVIGNNNVIHDMKIVADHIGETDGIDVWGNNNYVHDVSVENGDECVTIKAPTNGFRAENIQCHYTGGCNIGSFGRSASNVSVQNVYYRNVTLENSSGGVVLKTYPSASGVVKNLTYVDFTMSNVDYPIKIDNFWCPGESCPNATGNLVWEDVNFQYISGTGDDSTFRPLVSLHCIDGHTCSNIVFEDVSLAKTGGAEGTVYIANACGEGLSGLNSCQAKS